MTSIDANILLYSYSEASPQHAAAKAAQIVFCKSSGGQAEGEMDGFMLR